MIYNNLKMGTMSEPVLDRTRYIQFAMARSPAVERTPVDQVVERTPVDQVVERTPVDQVVERTPVCPNKMTCSVETCGSTGLQPVMDPRFNLREAAKNMGLLEMHLNDPGQRCRDCIHKHLMLIEGLLDEAVGLDKSGEYRTEIQNAWEGFKTAMVPVLQALKAGDMGGEVFYESAQKVREVRKPLCQKYACFSLIE
jgi:hypothetical protein